MTGFVPGLLKHVVPGSPGFFVLALAMSVAVWFGWRRGRRWSLVWMGVVIASYLTLSLPWTANHMVDALPGYPPLLVAADARGASGLVVLDGDNREGRINETARVYQLLRPKWVIISGGREFRRLIIEAGVPAAVVLWENRAGTTRAQAVNVMRLLQERRIDRVVLVASPLHMPRALAAVRAIGMDAVPSAAKPPYPDLPRSGLLTLIPRLSALDLSYDTLYEYMALAYYRHQGWIAAS